MIEVHMDSKRKPPYWVVYEGEVVFETDSPSEAIQWAINRNSPPIYIDRGITSNGPISWRCYTPRKTKRSRVEQRKR